MKYPSKLLVLNVMLCASFLAMILACGGDPADPPPGSLEEKLCGVGVSKPIPYMDGNGSTTIEIDFSYWNTGLIAGGCPEDRALQSESDAVAVSETYWTRDFTFSDLIATSSHRNADHDHTWIFRIDAARPDIMYTTLILKNGTKRLIECEFQKVKGPRHR